MNISENRLEELKEIEDKIGYKFNDIGRLELALCHSSYGNECKEKANCSNERVEFLGDAVLELVVSHILYRQYPNTKEGILSKLRSKMVCENSFANVARTINLGQYILMGKGEEISGGRDRDSLLADAFESLCGSVYLDGGFESAFNLIENRFLKDFTGAGEKVETIGINDYKTAIQEYYQKNSKHRIRYKVEEEQGPDHMKEFKIGIYLGNKLLSYGIGSSKKAGEQMAAKAMLIKLGIVNEEKD